MKKVRILMTAAEADKDHDAWVKLRNIGLGGSDAGIIMKYNLNKSRLRLWMEKTGQAEAPNLDDVESVYWGKKNEENIAQYFMEKTGKKVRRCGTMQSIEYPWMIANVDRMVEGENSGLEIKTAGVQQASYWKGDEIPDAYYAQCQHYMMVTGCEKWYICALIGGNRGLIKEVPRNETFIRDLFTAESAFWSMVENKIMPEVDGLDDTKKALTLMYPQATKEKKMEMESTADLEQCFKDYASYRKIAKEMETLATGCENKIKALMGDNETAVIGDHKATWNNVSGKTGIDIKRLQAENPEIYQKYLKVGKPTRRFSMK